MPWINFLRRNFSRVELDQRACEARLRFEPWKGRNGCSYRVLRCAGRDCGNSFFFFEAPDTAEGRKTAELGGH